MSNYQIERNEIKSNFIFNMHIDWFKSISRHSIHDGFIWKLEINKSLARIESDNSDMDAMPDIKMRVIYNNTFQ